MWDQSFKYDKPPQCPKGKPNGWEHHSICKVCLGENVGNTVVKLGSSDSSQALVSHFLQHHKEEWDNKHEEQRSLVDETRKSVKRLFDSITGPGDPNTTAQTGQSSSISGEGLSTVVSVRQVLTCGPISMRKALAEVLMQSGWINWWSSLWRST